MRRSSAGSRHLRALLLLVVVGGCGASVRVSIQRVSMARHTCTTMSEGRGQTAVATKNASRVSLEAGCTEPEDRWPKPYWLDALQRSGREGATSLFLTIMLALSPLLVAFVGSQFVSAYAIPSRSMDETLKVGDVVLAERLSTILHLPLERGDLVFFSPPPELEDIVSSTGGRVG